MSKQWNENKLSGQRNKNKREAPLNGNKSNSHSSSSKDFIAREKEKVAGKSDDDVIHIEDDAPPLLQDANLSIITIESSNDTIPNLSSSDTISIDSNTSGQFESLLAVGSSEDIAKDNETDVDTSVYHSCNTQSDSKTANNNEEEPSISEASTITADTSSNIKIYNSLEEFDKNLPPTVTLLTNEFGSKIYIVGTAHFSKESQDDVSLTIRNVRPDVVMVELCASRIHMLNHDEKTLLEEARDISFAKIQSITKSNGLVNGLFYILMLNMSAKLTKDLGMAPGGEFRRAVEEMKRLPSPVLHLGDRSINVTLQRAFNGLSLWQTIKIVFKLLFSNKTITKEEVEQCKQKDLLEELMEQMADEYPVFRDVFVMERDFFLCHSLQVAALPQICTADGKPKPVKVVGVVGIGHVGGICQNWGKVDESQLINILSIPPASFSNRMFKFSVKYGVLALIGYGIYKLVKPRLPSIPV